MRFLGCEGLIVPKISGRRFIWDLPIRVFHWSLVILIALSWWTEKAGLMDWHRRSGLTIVALLIFRLLWGIFGSSTARFAGFVKGPRAVIAYMRPGNDDVLPPGHNPLGGWSVIALLAILSIQVGTGLFAVDVDGIESGPLSYLVSFDTGRLFSKFHGYCFNCVLVLSALHIGAIAFYLVVRRRNLIRAMITGTQRATPGETGDAIKVPAWRSFVAVAVAAGIAYWIGSSPGG
jgi:cytochrome b